MLTDGSALVRWLHGSWGPRWWPAQCVREPPAFAYRPFDGTDAAVTEPEKAEVELQPAGRLQEGSQSFLVAPGVVINFGVVKGLELVFEGRLLEILVRTTKPDGCGNIREIRSTPWRAARQIRSQHRHRVRSALPGDSR